MNPKCQDSTPAWLAPPFPLCPRWSHRRQGAAQWGRWGQWLSAPFFTRTAGVRWLSQPFTLSGPWCSSGEPFLPFKEPFNLLTDEGPGEAVTAGPTLESSWLPPSLSKAQSTPLWVGGGSSLKQLPRTGLWEGAGILADLQVDLWLQLARKEMERLQSIWENRLSWLKPKFLNMTF